MYRTLSLIVKHPLTRDRPLSALARFVKWQVQSRLMREVEVDWIEGAKLLVANGMKGATGNIYCGIHEFVDMAFLLHILRPKDLFVDVGANIGSYTILASVVVGASTIAVEPDAKAMRALRRNVELNGVCGLVTTVEAAVGTTAGTANFTIGLDCTNHIASGRNEQSREVIMRTLDSVVGDSAPVLMKFDVEGFEDEVIAGAKHTLQRKSLLAIETEGSSEVVTNALLEAGFGRMYYDPFSRRLLTSPRHQQSNALFVRDRERVEARLQSASPRRILGRDL